MPEWAYYALLYLTVGFVFTELAIGKLVHKRRSGYGFLVALWPIPVVAAICIIIYMILAIMIGALVNFSKGRPQ